MKKITVVFLICALSAVLFSACKKSEVVALYFATENTAGSLDPQIAADATARILVRNCFEGLVTPGENGEILPGAAERWEVSEDGLTYTFYLRRGAKWHVTNTAGEELADKLPAEFAPEVTADDFVFALRRAADPATGAADASLLRNIVNAPEILSGEKPSASLGVRALSENVLQITLRQPQPQFLSLLPEPVFLPCNETFFTATGGRYGLLIKYMLSNGPFYLSRFDDTSYRLAKNPDYNGPHEAKADVVWLYTQSGDAAYFSSLNDGSLAGGYLSAAQAEKYRAGRHDTLVPLRDIMQSILFNTQNEILSNADLRLAFYYAAGANSLCETFGKKQAGNLFPAAVNGGKAAAETSDASPEPAKTHLQAGLAALSLESISVTLLCETSYETGLRKELQTWQQILGTQFHINIEALSAEELAGRVQSGDYEMALYPVTASSDRAYDWFAAFSSASGALTYYEDASFEAGLERQFCAENGTTDAALSRIVTERKFFLPLWEESRYFVCTDGVSGVVVLPGADRLYLYDAVKS